MTSKSELRQYFKQLRRAMAYDDVLNKSKIMCDILLNTDIYKNANNIMLYMPLGNEADTSRIIHRAYVDGKKVAFPLTDSDSGVITPVYVDVDTAFAKGAFSVMEPEKYTIANISDVDVVVVPGIVFDANGHRIGFGKGCYDRLLREYQGVKLGFCYSSQICDDIPSDEYDICMDYIITENGFVECNI